MRFGTGMAAAAALVSGCNSAPPEEAWRLQPAPNSPIQGIPKVNGVALADFNGDGRLDIAAVNGDPGQLLILINQGDRGFEAATSGRITVGGGASGIATGDLNGDGTSDIVISNHDSWSVGVILSNGDSTFAPLRQVVFAIRDPGAMAHAHNLALADLNNDGWLDMVMAQAEENSIVAALGDGAGGFAPVNAMLRAGDHPYTVVVGEFNGDGRLDAAAPNANSHDLTIGLGDGAGRFITPESEGAALPPRTLSLAAGDLNNDGHIDLVGSSDEVQDELSLHLGDGRGGFVVSRHTFNAPARVYSHVVADMTGDGMLDVIAPCIDRKTVQVWRAVDPASLRFQRHEFVTPGVDSQVLAIGDVNGDGLMDVVTAGWEESTLAVLLGRSGARRRN